MSKFSRWGLSVVTMVSVATVVLLVTGWGSALASTLSTSVIVANPPTRPVPVHGTVNVGNLPSQQAVTGTVNVGNLHSQQAVTGTVNVGNLPSQQAVTSADTTTAIGGESGVSVSSGQSHYGPSIDVAQFKAVRVAVFCNGCTNASQFAVYTEGREDYLLGAQNLQNFSNAKTTGSAVFESPGTDLVVELINNDASSELFWYDVYGRSN